MSLFSKDRVLVPIDFSEASFQALAETLEFVENASHLYVLHVLPYLNQGEPGVMWKTVTDDSRKQNVEKAFRDRCRSSNYEGIHFTTLIGNPSEEIIDYAKEQQINLIIIPSHGHTGIRRFLLGSVAERVVRFAHCPVLVLRQ